MSQWWDDPKELERVEIMLTRARVLHGRPLFREQPWKFSKDRLVANKLEDAMLTAIVDPDEGWEMTLSQIVKAASERGMRP
jgi:hypothetical protein